MLNGYWSGSLLLHNHPPQNIMAWNHKLLSLGSRGWLDSAGWFSLTISPCTQPGVGWAAAIRRLTWAGHPKWLALLAGIGCWLMTGSSFTVINQSIYTWWLHGTWASHSMVAGFQEALSQEWMFQEVGEKLSGHLRVMPRTGIASLLLYPIGQSCHDSYPDSRG